MYFFKTLAVVMIGVAFLCSSTQGFAHRPDRCFHKHFGGSSKCDKGIAKKRCTDAAGNVGKCVQGGSYCYCKITKKKKGKEVLNMGLDIGTTIYKSKKHKKKHHHPY